MSGSHDQLYLAGSSPLHRLAPECKLAATVLFVFTIVATPREAVWAFAGFAVILIALARVGQVPLGFVARRLVIEVPFLAFAALMPIVGEGERVDVLGVSLSVAGLWAAWNIVVKATLGVAATVLMAATTPVPDILRGLERLRVPRIFVGICAFMIRYGDVITAEMHRMRVARASRGYDARWLWHARAVASSAGTLFIRSYERGERVYLAMASRGYSGALPVISEDATEGRHWAAALALPLTGAVIAAVAWSLQ
jgi:cobalt/nickel transport system permease protein